MFLLAVSMHLKETTKYTKTNGRISRLAVDGQSLNSDRSWGVVIPVLRLHCAALPFVYFGKRQAKLGWF
jgi:hypothetical protein